MHSISTLAQHYRVKEGTVKRWARSYGMRFVIEGENHPTAKLKEKDIRAMRMLRNRGVKLDALATRFNVCPTTVSNIVRREAWKHVR